MKTFFTLALIVTVSFVYAQSTPTIVETINWLTWEQAIAQQQKDVAAYNAATNKKTATPPKKMFIDMYTSWCGWCKKMDATTFKDPNVITYMNKYYYPIKFNAERANDIIFNGHTFVNPAPGKTRSTHQFAVSILDSKLSYPAYVILDENVNRIVLYYGYKQVEDLFGILLFFKGNYHIPYRDLLQKQFQAKPAQ